MESCKGVHAHRRPLILGDIEKAIPLCGWPLEYKREKMGENTPKPLKNLQKPSKNFKKRGIFAKNAKNAIFRLTNKGLKNPPRV